MQKNEKQFKISSEGFEKKLKTLYKEFNSILNTPTAEIFRHQIKLLNDIRNSIIHNRPVKWDANMINGDLGKTYTGLSYNTSKPIGRDLAKEPILVREIIKVVYNFVNYFYNKQGKPVPSDFQLTTYTKNRCE
ncbi:MAG: hypothetical protein JXA54_06805 [Candidatus Heimdallarchaeota archaeon]|nr:hypothetical protein [Candidatus Heimdallarchaeota archaeon]